MSQQTNLNVSPYFDDFDANNDYYRVLFKPGYPVQARELTTLQSILQNQIERFGQHLFKEGAKVIPGNTVYNSLYYCVQLQNNYLGVPVAAYVDQLVGSKITGQTSGVSAVVDKVLLPQDSERGNLTLYINYIRSNTQDNSSQYFLDGESLLSDTTITSGLLGNSSISSGQPFAITIAKDSCTIGSSFSISEGIYFIRGQFVKVNKETLILNQYSDTPNYRVGLYIDEQIITSDIDESLNDNSQGYNNYSAPGADRLKISTFLFKKNLTDFDDNNFIELVTINNGILRTKSLTSDYNILKDELAKRTYAESGDYLVSPFNISLKESLNNNKGNNGIFNKGQFTYGGETPSDNLAIYQISPGKAFVRGYDIETISTTFLDANKPRTTKTLENQSIIYNTGPTLKLNRVYGTPKVGLGNTFVLSLMNERVGLTSAAQPGKEIGLSRVYDFKLESGSYNSSNKNLNEWHISLFDIQTFTNITLNTPTSLSVPTFVKGNSSGATAFLKDNVNVGVALTLYDVKGTFIANESLSFDGVESGFIGVSVTSYGISDIKSVYGLVPGGSTFTADTIQSDSFYVGIATISAASNGVSTVRSSNNLFPGNLVKVNNLIQYSDPFSSTDPILAKVVSVGSSTILITGVAAVRGVTGGSLPTSTLSVSDFKILTTNLESSFDNTLYTKLPKSNISDVNISNSTLTIRKNFNVNISQNKLSSVVESSTNETFLPFDVERYSLIRSDGSTETLTSDKFEFLSGGTQLQIYNLGSNDTNATLTATLQKINPKSKTKRKNRVNSLIINNSKYEGSGIGGTTLNDGLTYGNYPYGTRVQDEVISLNTPDIIQVHAIYESSDTNNPSAPKAVLSSISSSSSTTSELIIGEEIVGSTSGAIAIVAEKLTSSQISLIYKNQSTFKEGEIITFTESKVQAQIITLDSPSFDISLNYTFNNGQNGSFYDYGYITRKSNISEPNKKIKVYFSNGYYESTDEGDITTVNSYNTLDFATEIPSINGTRTSDIIDIRPRVSSYSLTAGSPSPLEFYGRTFDSTNNSSSNVLASDESILVSFSFYLGRIDRIYLTKEGNFQIKYGTPSENPESPVFVDDSLELATVYLPPYLYSTAQALIKPLEHKRYRMVDIKQLENRIKNLEYYTSLSLLETNTSNLFVPDSSGLNRFKSGFFVDNFTSQLAQESGNASPIKNSIDTKHKELRPSHYTTSIDLINGPVVGVDPTRDLLYNPVEGINIKKTGDIITLDYAEVEWVKQSIATRTENVTPFIVNFWQGTIELVPSSDTWVDTVRIEPKTTIIEGNYQSIANTVNSTGTYGNYGYHGYWGRGYYGYYGYWGYGYYGYYGYWGYYPSHWNSWGTFWSGVERTTVSRVVQGQGAQSNQIDVYNDTYSQTVNTNSYFNPHRTLVTEQYDTISSNDKVVSTNISANMRSRNIEFIAKRLKPSTRVYAFFDGIDVTRYCVPKLLEINMRSGTFKVGETVIGYVQQTGLGAQNKSTSATIKFRVSQLNHKEGPYDSPIETYPQNPYTLQSLPSTYSSTSTILNVDTFSLSNAVQGEFSGWVAEGMLLVGQTSNAQALVSKLRLITDGLSNLVGSFYVPNPNVDTNPKFESGTKTFSLTDSKINDKNSAITIAEENFVASGTVETVQKEIISVRNARVETKPVISYGNTQKTTGSTLVSSVKSYSIINNQKICWSDPLAQSFLVDSDGGVFLTRCDIFFQTKDTRDSPVTLQIRTMDGGYPTQNVIPFSEVVLNPSRVNLSVDGSFATPFLFKSPVYLENGKEYCICLLSNSNDYQVFISRVGEKDLINNSSISKQPYLGSLFKSQNASTWEPSQWEDLKFTLYRADFIETGTVEFYNPELTEGNNQIAKLFPNALIFNSRKIRVSLASTISDSGLTLGNTIIQNNTSGSGNYVGSAGIATGSLSISNSGIGYTPSSGSYTFNDVLLNTITGKGTGATANITISNGVAAAATIVNGGSGYQVGDVLGINTVGSSPVGRNANLTITTISNINQIIIDNVQGEFETGATKSLKYINNSGITTDLNSTYGGNILINKIDVENDGLHIKVNHPNHGMYAKNNYVTLYGVESDIKPTKLTLDYESDSTGQISVDNATDFSTFEGVGVGTSNPGYLLIGDEIIEYTSVSGNIIGGNIERGDNPVKHPMGSPVYKYEINGVSLKRINKTHYLDDADVIDPVGLDFYHISLDMSLNGTDRTTGIAYSNLYQNQTKSAGGFNIRATQNIPYEIITPMVQNLTVQGTSLSAQIRTITNTSVSGNEIPFIDTGFEPVTINQSNYLQSPRIICSKVNETLNLDNIEGNKSFNMRITLGTTNTRLSPVIDTQRVNTILTSNRINKVIDNYSKDNRVNSIIEDPTAFQYISKEIALESSSTSIKIILSAYLNSYCDIRAFYSISNISGGTPIFTPFPGYDNLQNGTQIVSLENSSGLSDSFITPSSSLAFNSEELPYREYTFTADNLPSFRNYRIKLIGTSTNQVYVPRIKDLRVIALA